MNAPKQAFTSYFDHLLLNTMARNHVQAAIAQGAEDNELSGRVRCSSLLTNGIEKVTVAAPAPEEAKELDRTSAILDGEDQLPQCIDHEPSKSNKKTEKHLMNEQRMRNVEISTENIEKQLMRWTNSFNSKFDSMHSIVEELQTKNDYLTTKNKNIEANLLEKNKLIKYYHNQIDVLNERVRVAEERLQQTTNEVTSSKEQHKQYENKLKEKDIEIQNLQNLQIPISVIREEMRDQICDLEKNVKSARKEEKQKQRTRDDEINSTLLDIQETMKKKAMQSDLDKLQSKIESSSQSLSARQPSVNKKIWHEQPVDLVTTEAQPIHNNTMGTPSLRDTMVHDSAAVVHDAMVLDAAARDPRMVHDTMSARPKEVQQPSRDERHGNGSQNDHPRHDQQQQEERRRAENSRNKQGERPQHLRNNTYQSDDDVYRNQEVVLIMDSNMNFIEGGRFWHSTFKLKCGRADLLENKLPKYDLSAATDIIVGTGTNDIERGADADSIFAQLKKTADDLSSRYKSNVYLAQLPPMEEEDNNRVVQELNNLIKNESSDKINVIFQDDLTTEDLHDKKHVRIRSLRKFIKNMKDAMRNVYNRKGAKRVPTKQKNVSENRREPTNTNNPSNCPPQPQQPPKNTMQGQDILTQLVAVIQKSNENLLHGIKNSLMSLSL